MRHNLCPLFIAFKLKAVFHCLEWQSKMPRVMFRSKTVYNARFVDSVTAMHVQTMTHHMFVQLA